MKTFDKLFHDEEGDEREASPVLNALDYMFFNVLEIFGLCYCYNHFTEDWIYAVIALGIGVDFGRRGYKAGRLRLHVNYLFNKVWALEAKVKELERSGK